MDGRLCWLYCLQIHVRLHEEQVLRLGQLGRLQQDVRQGHQDKVKVALLRLVRDRRDDLQRARVSNESTNQVSDEHSN